MYDRIINIFFIYLPTIISNRIIEYLKYYRILKIVYVHYVRMKIATV